MVDFSGMKISAQDLGWSGDNFYIKNFVLQSNPNQGKQMVRIVRIGQPPVEVPVVFLMDACEMSLITCTNS